MAKKYVNNESFNSSVSVDCVILGFDGKDLNLLLIRRESNSTRKGIDDYKLPGSLIYESEELESAAYRVLENMTGLSNIFLEQLQVFSNPNRVKGDDLKWLNSYYGIQTNRVITVAYYSLLKLDDKIRRFTLRKGAVWRPIDSVKRLGLDHKEIATSAISTITSKFFQSPIAFELLPKRFTIRQLQTLYEAVIGTELDSRNFRKKITNLGYLEATGEREKNVAHKPAQYYTFNRIKYEKERKNSNKISRLYF
ncbi:MAG: NUDIX domain-containing protein [Rikenellaceae bacterium]